MPAIKKLPLRKCIGCGQQKEKKQLTRAVRTPEGEIEIDFSGRANGRGAYICRSEDCLAKAVRSHALERSLHCQIDPAIYEKLQSNLSEYLSRQ